jgi:hypothetical protein
MTTTWQTARPACSDRDLLFACLVLTLNMNGNHVCSFDDAAAADDDDAVA